jgi:hypothetical protein
LNPVLTGINMRSSKALASFSAVGVPKRADVFRQMGYDYSWRNQRGGWEGVLARTVSRKEAV